MAYETFEKAEGIIQGISRGDSCCSMMLSVISGSSIINIVVTGETVIIDNVRLRTGMRIAAFYDANLPAPTPSSPRKDPAARHNEQKRTFLSYSY